jgi:hypothetical protein
MTAFTATLPAHPLTLATAKLALGRTTGTPGTLDCNVNRAVFNRRDEETFTCHVYENGALIHHETRALPGAIETFDCLIELGYQVIA